MPFVPMIPPLPLINSHPLRSFALQK
jgi:hypothetical protein